MSIHIILYKFETPVALMLLKNSYFFDVFLIMLEHISNIQFLLK
jgi:hypothetical protein